MQKIGESGGGSGLLEMEEKEELRKVVRGLEEEKGWEVGEVGLAVEEWKAFKSGLE